MDNFTTASADAAHFNHLFDDAVIAECRRIGITPEMLQAGYRQVCLLGPHGPPPEEVAMNVFLAMLNHRQRGGGLQVH